MDNSSEGSKLPSLLISARRYHENRELEPQSSAELILQWAMAYEVTNYNFYNALESIKGQVQAHFRQLTGQRPEGPDSRYSPFNPFSAWEGTRKTR